MTEKLKYELVLGVSDGAHIDEIEDFLQQLLLDLYEQGQVESIRVTKEEHDKDIQDIPKIIELIDELKSEEIKGAIDTVKELENLDNDE